MKYSKRMKIAMVGMYGGMWREFNPGCLVLGIVTLSEIKKRLPRSKVDMFAIDNRGSCKEPRLVRKDGVTLRFFSRKHQQYLLRSILPGYDAVIFGGDIIWGGDDVVSDNEIFFAGSPHVPHNLPKKLIFNSVHTFYPKKDILRQKRRFRTLCGRASYVAVRTRALVERLKSAGIRNIRFIPDPALLYRPLIRRSPNSEKSILVISLRCRLAEDLATALPLIDFGKYKVNFMSYSRQYDNRGTVKLIRQRFGDVYSYDERYLSPLKSFAEIAKCGILITDTYHGAIAAAVSGVPFISIDVEKDKSSRKQELLSILGLPAENNIRLSYGDPLNPLVLAKEITKLLPRIQPVRGARLNKARLMINKHFNRIAAILAK